MSLVPSTDGATTLEGRLDFCAAPDGGAEVEDSYKVRIELAGRLPRVWESGHRIKRDLDNHIGADGTLCLGSPLRLAIFLAREASLVRFVDQCLVPFLYTATLRERGEKGFPFGALEHGEPGLLDDYEKILGLKGREALQRALHMLSLKRRVANKLPCPCGCGRRLGKCPLHDKLNQLRKVMPRSHFAARRSDLDH